MPPSTAWAPPRCPASVSGVTHVPGLNCYRCLRTVPCGRLTPACSWRRSAPHLIRPVRQPTMTPVARSLLAAIVALSCATHSDRVDAETPTVPPGWTVISPPVTEEGWLCANWARQHWSVEVAESGAVRIDQATGRGGPITLQMQGGRLIVTNRGEFGGALEWEPTGSSRRELI